LIVSSSRQDNKQNDICSTISDPLNHHFCRCNQCSTINTRVSTFIPFHRRPRTTPPFISDPSNRNKIENPSESTENNDTLIESTSSPILNTNTQQTTNEKPSEWIASTPTSVGMTGPPSVLTSITNLNSVSSNSPASNSHGLKRPIAMVFDDTNTEEDEREQHKQTYDFYRTDSL
jgi:hypothetical protein